MSDDISQLLIGHVARNYGRFSPLEKDRWVDALLALPAGKGPRLAAAPDTGIYDSITCYVFPNLQIAPGVYGDVSLGKKLLNDGRRYTQEEWLDGKCRRGVMPPTTVASYQMVRRALSSDTKEAAEVLNIIADDWVKYWPVSASRVDFGKGNEAVVTHTLPDGSEVEVSTALPEGTRHYDSRWSYEPLPIGGVNSRFSGYLNTILGDGSDEAGAVFRQLLDSRWLRFGDNGVRLWTPAMSNRRRTRALVLGVYDNDRFGIGADDSISSSRPARGVAAQKIHRTGFLETAQV